MWNDTSSSLFNFQAIGDIIAESVEFFDQLGGDCLATS
jgi:hypothetical protein